MEKLRKVTAFFVVLFVTASFTFAQKPEVLSGDPTALKSIKSWDVDVIVKNPEIKKNGTMEEFMAARVTKYNAREEEENMGDTWKKQWLGNFDGKYNKKFCALLTKNQDKIGADVTFSDKDEKAAGKVIIEVEWMWLGYVNPFKAEEAKVTTVISFQDKNGKELLKIRMSESPGMPGAFTAQQQQQNAWFGDDAMGEMTRVTESFAKCGKDLAGWLGKKAYK